MVVSGGVSNPFNRAASSPALSTGGVWTVPAESVHLTACDAAADCGFYFHARATFDSLSVCE